MAILPEVDRRRLRFGAVFFLVIAMVDSVFYFDAVAGVGASPPPPPSFWAQAYLTGLSSLLFWGVSCALCARSKNRSAWWGLAGIMICWGVVLVGLLPVRRSVEEIETPEGDYPRPRQNRWTGSRTQGF